MEVSSPMFVKAANKVGNEAENNQLGGTATDEVREKQPRFVKHVNQIDSKPMDIKRKPSSSPSPNRR